MFRCSRCKSVVPWTEGGSPDEVDLHGDLCASCWALVAREDERIPVGGMVPWSRLPGLGTADGQPAKRQGKKDVHVFHVLATSVRLPEPKNRDCTCPGWVYGLGRRRREPADHETTCRGARMELVRESAIAEARSWRGR